MGSFWPVLPIKFPTQYPFSKQKVVGTLELGNQDGVNKFFFLTIERIKIKSGWLVEF